MTGKDTSKLPLWARRYIEKLEADATYYKDKAMEVSGDLPSRIRLRRMPDETPKFLPDDTILAYAFGGSERDYLETYITGDGRFCVRSSRGLRVYPTSGNSILIEWGDWP